MPVSQMIAKLLTAWPLVAKRSKANWRLLSTVVIGVFMASAIMAGTVIYFDSLKELALKSAISKLTRDEINIVIKSQRGPTNTSEQEKVTRVVTREVNGRVAWLLRDQIRGVKSATFYLTEPGLESTAGEDNSRSYFGFLPRFYDHVALLPGGRKPQEQALSAPGEPLLLEAVIPDDAARQFGVGVGDELSAVPFWTDAIPYARVIISGVFERTDPTDEIWYLSERVFQASTSGSFDTIPFFISESTYMGVLGAAFKDLDSTYAWLLAVDAERLNSSNATDARVRIQLMGRRLATNLFSFQQFTELDEALLDYDIRLFFSKIPMFVILILIAVVILYYVITLSSLLVEQQRSEIALLRSRGATSAQILSVYVLEGLTISVLAIVVAPILSASVISLLGFTPAFSDLSGNSSLDIRLSSGAYFMSALGGLLSFAALMIPAVQASRIGVTRHRQESARPTSEPFFQRYYLDVMLLIVSAILFRQLDERGSVLATSVFGSITVDRILLIVPALILVSLALVALRLFPLAIRYLSGESPNLTHVLVAGTILILIPSIALDQIASGGSLLWLAQVALLATLGGIYWATSFAGSTWLKIPSIILQGAIVLFVILIADFGFCLGESCLSLSEEFGPALPLQQVFIPLLIAIVPAQLAFLALSAWSERAPVGYTLGLWQMSRNPTHYARLALLLILMAGLGIFAASFGGTLQRSFEDRALYATGADLRLDGVIIGNRGSSKPVLESYQNIPGIETVSRAYRGFGTDLSRVFGESYTMFSVDSDVFADVAYFRDDFTAQPAAELISRLPTRTKPEGLELPQNSTTIGLRLKADRPHPTTALTVRIKDTNDRYFTYFVGTVESREWFDAEVSLTRRPIFGGRQPLQPVAPLELMAISVHETNGRRRLSSGSITIDAIRVRTSDNRVVTIEPFNNVDAWQVLRVVPQSANDIIQLSNLGRDDDEGSATFIWTEGAPVTSRGMFHGPNLDPLPVLASKSFLDEAGHGIGDQFEVSVQGHRLQVNIVNEIDFFPTLDTINDLFLISDIASLFSYANLETTGGELRPNEIWLDTATNGHDRSQLIERLSHSDPFSVRKVHDRVQSLADSKVDPLVEAGWRALLFIAFASILVLSSLGFLVHAYVSFRDREVQFALMRTIGFSMRQLILLVWLEQVLIIGAGLALGTWMGGRLGAIVMPFLGNDDQGGQVLPPFILEVNWGTLAITYAAMGLVFALIIGGVLWFIHKISLQRILRLGEM